MKKKTLDTYSEFKNVILCLYLDENDMVLIFHLHIILP